MTKHIAILYTNKRHVFNVPTKLNSVLVIQFGAVVGTKPCVPLPLEVIGRGIWGWKGPQVRKHILPELETFFPSRNT